LKLKGPAFVENAGPFLSWKIAKKEALKMHYEFRHFCSQAFPLLNDPAPAQDEAHPQTAAT
jgi:hypothetical protein